MSEKLGPEPHEFQEQVLEAIEQVKSELDTEVANENKEHKWLKWLGISTAILSSTAAVAAMLGGYYANESSVAQSQASDRWSQFQADSTKSHVYEVAVITLTAQEKPIPKIVTQELARLAGNRLKIQADVNKSRAKSRYYLHQYNLFSYAIAVLQVGVSLSAIAVIARDRRIWYVGMGLGTIGIAFMLFAATSTNIAAPISPVQQSDIE